jgi:hypothetical protein
MGVDMGKLKERFEKKQATRADRMKVEDGDSYIRILPPTIEYFSDEVDYISIEYMMHFQLGFEGKSTAEVCPRSWNPKAKCPICESVWQLYKTGDATDKALASKIRAKTRHLFNVIDLNNKDKGIQILETGSKIYERLVRFLTSGKYGDILDLDKGRNITLTKVPAKESNTGYVDYDLIPEPEVTSVREFLPENYKEGIGLLLKQKPVAKSYDELQAVLEGRELESESEPEVEEKVEKDDVDSEPEVVEKPEAKVETAKATPPKVEPKSKTEPIVSTPKSEGGKPKCFGVDYGPKRDQCVACDVKGECRTVFLEI